MKISLRLQSLLHWLLKQEGKMPGSITVSDVSLTFTAPGQTHKLSATVRNPKGKIINSTVTWTSSDVTIAIVDQTGLVTALNKNGNCNIKATAGNVETDVATTVAIPVNSGGGDNTPRPGGGDNGGTG